ncbi:MAG: protein kinase [Planctomycetota bacterium]
MQDDPTRRPSPPPENEGGETIAFESAQSQTVVVGAPAALPKIGNYRIERELGRGGMGVVYLAEDTRLKRRVALKVLADAIASNPAALEAFEREARLLAALQHANIAMIFSLEIEGALRFFTMEFVEGINLAARLRAQPLELTEALGIGRQIARALQAAHRRGVVHRDLKPANLAIAEDGQIKILDFGIAAARSECARRLAVTETPGLAGTPGYMSPEQYVDSYSDERVDVWAFGCVLYECLTGRPAFVGDDLATFRRAAELASIDWDRLPSQTPQRVRELLQRCLTPEPDQRLASMGEARRILEEVLSLLTDTPALKQRAKAPGNLPSQASSFVGRNALLTAVGRRVMDTPLVTLTGTGGSGKTRLAIEVATRLADRFPDGVYWVELAPLTEPDRVVGAVATTLGVQEEPGRALVDSLATHLAHRSVLLLLDSCEPVLDGVASLLPRLLRESPKLRVLASSRVRLGVTGEGVQPVAPLTLPPLRSSASLSELAASEAVTLFLERARAVRPGLELSAENATSVAEICRRLDGIPLALELAAARVGVLTLADLERRLVDRFRLLRGGNRNALPHQQTLEATIAWSYDHLDSDEQLLLRRLSVFAGGWSLEAAEQVCASSPLEDWQVLDLLSSLIERSLVEANPVRSAGGECMRYRLLESIREFARLRSQDAGEIPEQWQRHRDYFSGLAERAHQELRGPRQGEWFGTLEGEYDNLRSAIERCVRSGDQLTTAMQMANHLAMFWIVRGHWREGRSLLEDLLEHPAYQAADSIRGRGLCWAGNLAACQGDYDTAQKRVQAGLAIHEQLANEDGIAAALNDLAIVERKRGELLSARGLFERSLELRRRLGDSKGVAVALSNLGLVALEQQDHEAAAGFYDEALRALREVGDQQAVTVCLNSLGSIEFGRGNLAAAAAYYDEALALSRSMGNRRTERNILHNLGLVAQRQGDLPVADRWLRESLDVRLELGDQQGVLLSLLSLSDVALDADDLRTARGLLNEVWKQAPERLESATFATQLAMTTARFAAQQGRFEDSARLIGWARDRQGETATAEALNEAQHPDWQARVRASLEPLRWEALLEEGQGRALKGVSAFLNHPAE